VIVSYTEDRKRSMCPSDLIPELLVWERAVASASTVVAKVMEGVKQSNTLFPIPIRLWKAERDLKALVGMFSSLVDRVRREPALRLISEKLNVLLGKTVDLCASIESLYATAKHLGYTNRTLTAASLNLIKLHGERLFDEAEVISLILDPHTDEKFRSAREEFERGECVGMELFS
jgi:hypothetical protein